MEYREENNYPKAFAATGAVVAVLVALCFFIVFSNNPPILPDGTGGILVNYGTTDEGMGKDIHSLEEVSKAEKANKTQNTKVTPTPPTEQKTQPDVGDKKVVTQNTEDAPEVADKAKKNSQTVATQTAKPQPQQVVNQAALFKGNTNKGTGSGDGTTNTPGNQGSPNGSALAENYGPGGSGNGLNLPNWHFVVEPDVKNIHRVPGIVVIDFTIDQNGTVIEEHVNRGRTRATADLVEGCYEAIKNSKFASTSPANGNQRGSKTFIFKVD